ncbi:MFS transporter [Georgenia subflava]|uniref:MFS transporter n=1 Tax=Georgenia subflava TaxID=1622177 RepID=A0A6N7EKT3_9MICO|nr:MFS transporter [Georgenia subflava]
MPLYPLYALLFAETGLSAAQISMLFAIWSAVSVLAEVPTGILADRFSRRWAVVASSVLQAAGFALWIAAPGFAAFAAGFVLWAVGGALSSGAFEALLYDALAAAGAERHFPRLLGRVGAMGLLAQVPTALAATALFAVGGFTLAGWVSVGCCLVAAVLATRLRDVRPVEADAAAPPAEEPTVRAGARVIAGRPELRGLALALALLWAVDGLEEYFGLLAADWGAATAAIPLTLLAVPLAGAAGSALGGRAARLSTRTLAVVLGGAALLLAGAAVLARPGGMALVAAFYFGYQLVQVVMSARLQQHVPSVMRATVTSVAGAGSEVATLGLYAAWAFGGLPVVTAGILALALLLPLLVRRKMPRRT